MARETVLAQFNKINKTFIMLMQKPDDLDLLNHDLYLYKEIEIDVEAESINGNYDSYTVVSIADQPREINEDTLNEFARDKIIRQYPLEDQLSILGTMLERVADSVGIECEELKDMNDFIAEVKRTNQIRKDYFAANPDYTYYSTEDLDAIQAEKYDGGIAGNDEIVGDI